MISRAQSILGYILVFISIALLALYITRVWVWFNANYALRQTKYEDTRLSAGQSYDAPYTPKDIGSTPLPLTDEWIFNAEPSGIVKLPHGGTPPGECIPCDQGGEMPRCETCGERDEVAICLQRAEYLEVAAGNLEAQAAWLEEKARDMRRRADECSKPWEICWWGSWGKTAEQLREAANQLDLAAADLRAQAQKLKDEAEVLRICCPLTDPEQRQVCIASQGKQVCSEAVKELIDDLDEEILVAEEAKRKAEAAIIDITRIIDYCNSYWAGYCKDNWAIYVIEAICDYAGVCTYIYAKDYAECYEVARNRCCAATTTHGAGRKCDDPNTNCSTCSLAVVRDQIQFALDHYIKPMIRSLNDRKARLSLCPNLLDCRALREECANRPDCNFEAECSTHSPPYCAECVEHTTPDCWDCAFQALGNPDE